MKKEKHISSRGYVTVRERERERENVTDDIIFQYGYFNFNTIIINTVKKALVWILYSTIYDISKKEKKIRVFGKKKKTEWGEIRLKEIRLI